jgi:LysR family transcriptional regulator, transcriptional activator of the cysJI operon
MDLDSMKIFADVVETGSFSRAAALNSLTQTAVSRRIQAVEGRLGCRLIERSKGRKGIVTTAAGDIYYEGCKDLLQCYRSIVERIGEAGGEVTGTLRVATVYSVGLHELPRHVKDFLRQYPRASIHVEYNRTNRIYDDCLSGRADLGIVAYPTEQPRIGVIPLRTDELVMICAPDHPLASRPSVGFGDLSEVPFVGFEPDIPTRRAVDRHAREAGVALAVTMAFDNIETIKRSVEVGLGISVVPRGTVEREVQTGTLAAVRLVPRCERPVGAIYRRGQPLTLTARKFVELLTQRQGGAAF